jgi:TPR repeat protein
MYDGGVSPVARKCLAVGNQSGAFREYARLAGLGSGKARCIIAYAQLVGCHILPKNIAESKRMAISATGSEPGFGNYILGCIAMLDNNWELSFQHFKLSIKAGFIPAFSASAKLSSQLYRNTEKQLRDAETVLRHAVRKGQVPAMMYLAKFYAGGSRGLIKRIFGLLAFPFTVMAMYFACRFAIFSMRSFFYHPSLPELLKEQPSRFAPI